MSDKTDDEKQTSPYAGRWVARLEGRIIAQGGTPEQAREAAHQNRYKERAEISFMPPNPAFSLSPLVERVSQVLPDQEIYLVGGAVRDALLGHVSHDLDFAVPQDAIGRARKVANALGADFYVLDESFDAARVIVRQPPGPAAPGRDVLDFSSFRASEGTVAIDADLRGRDFTVNSMAYDPRAHTILDPLNGASDLRAKLLRACSPAAMEDDSIRILRGVRMAAALGFKIDRETRESMKRAASRLPGISAERQRDELFKILEGPRPDASIRALEMLGVFPYLVPDLSAMKGLQQSAPHVADVWEHTLSVMQYLEGIVSVLSPGYDTEKKDDLFTGVLSLRLGRYRAQFAEHFAKALNPERSIRALLFLAALYHDVAKPQTKSVAEGGRIRFLRHETVGAEVAARRGRLFNLSNDEVERLRTIIANHMRFHFQATMHGGPERAPTRRSIYRFFRDTGEAGVDLILLGLADLRGVHGHTLTQEMWTASLDVAREFLENYWEKPREAVAPQRLLNGDELMRHLGLKPGPMVGWLLEAIREAQATGEVSSRDDALRLAAQKFKESGNQRGAAETSTSANK